MGQSVMQKDCFAVFKFWVTLRAHIIRYDCIFELLIIFQQNLIEWYITVSWSVLYKNSIVVFKIKVTVKVQNSIES